MESSFRVIDNTDDKTWDAFIASHNGHLLQTAAWGELKSRFGWSAQRLALERDGATAAGAQILFRRLPLGLTLAYVPRGPVCDPNDRDTLTALLDAICAAARARSAFTLKIELNWLENATPDLTSITNLPPAIRHLQSATCIQPRATIHVDLTRDLDAILAEMKQKWRYNIRLAERKGIAVREGNAGDLPKFYELLQVTSKRDAFPIHTFDYYRAAFELLTRCDRARLFVAEFAGEPLAAVFVTGFAGEAIYLYGASGNAHREKMPNHALHWHAMQWAKARGCIQYDLWGIGATAEATIGATHFQSASHLGQGLYQFKQGFGGHIIEYAGAYDVIFSRWKFALYERALAMRRGAMA